MSKDSEAGREVVPAEAVEVFDPAARPASMPKRDAVKLTGSIKKSLDYLEDRREALQALVDEAFHGKAWAAMGYASWQQYTATEFQMSRSRSYQLVNWAHLNRELEAEGLPPALTEGEARRTRKARNEAKSTAEESPVTPADECLHVDTPAAPDQPERVAPAAGTVEEPPIDLALVPTLVERVAEVFKTDSEMAAEALLECKPTDARGWDPALFPRLESWVAQVAAILQPEKKPPASGAAGSKTRPRPAPPAADRNGCSHKDAAGKETVNKLPYAVVCTQCGTKVR